VIELPKRSILLLMPLKCVDDCGRVEELYQSFLVTMVSHFFLVGDFQLVHGQSQHNTFIQQIVFII
jgi:hypothetical protein